MARNKGWGLGISVTAGGRKVFLKERNADLLKNKNIKRRIKGKFKNPVE